MSCTISADELVVEGSYGGHPFCGAYTIDPVWHEPGAVVVYDHRNGYNRMILMPDLALGLLQFLQLNEERLREMIEND